MEHLNRSPQSRTLVISCSPNEQSNSRILANEIAAVGVRFGHDVTFFDIRDLPPMWTVKDGPDNLTGKWHELRNHVIDADLIVFAAPIYFYTVGSPARVIVENMGAALENKRAIVVTAAGSDRSHLAVRDFRDSLMFEHNVVVFPQTVQITDGDIIDGKLVPETKRRIAQRFEEVSKLIPVFSH